MKLPLFVRKYPFLLLSLFFCISRLLFLTRLPIFNDESIYLDWGAREINSKGAFLFYSLYDAKPPLLMWIFGIAEMIIRDPLFAGRLVSVISGFIALIGLYKIGVRFLTSRIAIISSLLYICIPLFVFYDRQALMESAMSAIGVWSLYFFLLLSEKNKIRHAIVLGFIIGLGIWIKYNALIFLLTSLSSAAIILWIKKKNRFNFILYLTIVVLVCSISLFPLFLQDLFWETLASTTRFTLSLNEIVQFPLLGWLRNGSAFIEISFWHITPLAFITGILGAFILIRQRFVSQVITIWFFISILLVLITVRTVDQRYIVSYLPIVPIASATFLSWLIDKNRIFGLLIIAITIFTALLFSIILILDPIKYINSLNHVTVYSQKQGYITGWTSGYGIPETVSFLNKVAENQEILVGVQLETGNPESAMFAYFLRGNVIPFYISPKVQQDLSQYDCLSSTKPIYYVSRGKDMGGNKRFFEEVKRFYKPDNIEYIGLYKIKPVCVSSKILNINLKY